MKFKLTYILILSLFVSCNQNKLNVDSDYKSHKIPENINASESGSEPINEDWVKADSLFFSELTKILKNNERDIIDILKIDKNDRRTKLGFGYEQIEASMGKGYAGIFYNLILKDGQVVSYEFTPKFPSEKNLKERYLKLFSGIFEINENIIHKRYYNIAEMKSPLKIINSEVSLNENLKFLMTPFSGTKYGFSGGIGGNVLTNRAIFLEESKNITPEICQILMHSKNPATRLMAIEYYMKNKSEFKNQGLINDWIEKVYSELPTIETFDGCIVNQRDSKKLVSEYAKRKN